MELTKFEKRVTDPKYPHKCKWTYLYLGIAFFTIGVIVVIYGYTAAVPNTKAMWDNKSDSLMKIAPKNINEKEMHDIALSILDASRKGWIGFVEEKTRSMSIIFFLIGAFLIGIYFRETRYIKLIEKIRTPNK